MSFSLSHLVHQIVGFSTKLSHTCMKNIIVLSGNATSELEKQQRRWKQENQKSIIRLNKRHHCTTNIAYRVSMIGESRLANLLAITYLHGKVSSR